MCIHFRKYIWNWKNGKIIICLIAIGPATRSVFSLSNVYTSANASSQQRLQLRSELEETKLYAPLFFFSAPAPSRSQFVLVWILLSLVKYNNTNTVFNSPHRFPHLKPHPHRTMLGAVGTVLYFPYFFHSTAVPIHISGVFCMSLLSVCFCVLWSFLSASSMRWF